MSLKDGPDRGSRPASGAGSACPLNHGDLVTEMVATKSILSLYNFNTVMIPYWIAVVKIRYVAQHGDTDL